MLHAVCSVYPLRLLTAVEKAGVVSKAQWLGMKNS